MKPIKNKGMFLEEVLNITHIRYIDHQLCTISKIPTSIGLVKTDNNSISQAFFRESNSCDYIGNFAGRYFEFEAKETYENSFNWKALRKNQIKKLNEVLATNGLAFLIIYFGEYDSFYFIDFAMLQFNVNNLGNNVPYEWFELNGQELKLTSELKLDYIKHLSSLTNWI